MDLRATYRLQFTAAFRFADAAALAPYLADLGISHVYASPVFAARPGSTPRLRRDRSERLQPRARQRGRLPRHGRRLPRPRPRPHPRHRAEPHGDRRRGQPLLARRARMGTRRAPTRAGSTSTGPRPIPASPARSSCPSSAPPTADVLADGGARAALRRRPRAASRSGRTTRHKLPICPRHYGTHPARRRPRRRGRRGFDAAAPLDPADRRWSELEAGLAAVPPASVAARSPPSPAPRATPPPGRASTP